MALGRFITFEGGEGAGKSTQIRRLGDALAAAGQAVCLTREPGGSDGAEQIRKLLVEGDAAKWDALTETLLHGAARRDHLQKVILPALDRGEWVLCDRFQDSTVAYQGYGHGIDQTFLAVLYNQIAGALTPDLTLIFDIPVEQGLQRAGGRGGLENRYESMDVAFHEKLRQGFLDIAKRNPDRTRVINACKSMADVTTDIFAVISTRFSLELNQNQQMTHG